MLPNGDESTIPTPTPNAAPPGALADHIAGAQTFLQMPRAKNIEIIIWTGEKENTTHVPEDRTATLAERLAQLLREDMLYTAESTGLMGRGDAEIRLLYPLPDIRIALFLKQHRIRFTYPRQNSFRGKELLLDPIGKPLWEMIQQNASADAQIKRLSFSALPPKPIPTPKGIPEEVLRTVHSVRPGMRRADVLRILRTEGGLSSRLHQFLYPKPIGKYGELAKVTVGFVPSSTRIRWLNGVGYPLDPLPAPLSSEERGDDIVITVTAPFLEVEIHN